MGAKRALVIDDDELSRDLVRAMLERLGVYSTLVATGAAGLDASARQGFDLVFVDLKLPDMDGIALIARLRQSPSAARIPIVVVSGAEAQESRERCLQAGCAGHLPKPFTYQDFERVVAPLLVNRH